MAKPVYCDKCHGEINNREDLVTATMFVSVVPYHESCYSKDLKGAKTFFLANQPINGFSGNFGVVVAALFGFGLLVFAEGGTRFTSVIFLLAVFYRLYSYIAYERHLEK
ncbi:hypothetical protein [Alkalihalobacillus sp. AL-G]|uniref:hypothetical protein n=1 Tax=Alkalihalobacillus sp. AL-G TaxID=2926399 RepID=UPI00272A2CE6|nr:hypothetical protein [Alkalihalobacillus sp. AL-G]WLD94612.1 hypothetical protein MOJ78_06925 [Alkalihalobacillus sp. AL-G]